MNSAAEEPVRDEAMENLKEAARLIGVVRNSMRATDADGVAMNEHPAYVELYHRVLTAVAMTEAAYVEAKRGKTALS